MMKRHLIITRFFALALLLLGLLLLVGGYKLIKVGGSSWYLLSGGLLTAIAVLLWQGNRLSAWLYAGLMGYTLMWSITEVGLDAWALLPRLLLLTALGLWFLTPMTRQSLRETSTSRPQIWITAIAGMSALVFILIAAGAMTQSDNTQARSDYQAPPTEPGESVTSSDWLHYGNDASGTRYSPLDQINTENVSRLKLAWSFRTGDLAKDGQTYNFEATPLKAGHLLYTCTPSGQAFAIDATSGKVAWHFDPHSNTQGVSTFTCRGVSFHSADQDANHARQCAQRIFVPTPDARIWAVDAQDGTVCNGFGHAGYIDLLTNLGEVSKGSYYVTSPPLVMHDRLIVGANVKDNLSTDMPSGVVRAYDVATGALEWAWDVGNPEHHGAPADNETYTRSTPNAWAPMVADEAHDLIFIPTGNPAPDYWGKQRRSFDERYGSSLVAVDASTGQTRWSFQVTHHDLWDNDLSSQPTLLEMPTPTGQRSAVAFGTKQGHIYVLDRMTGEPIVPVHEKAVPQSSDLGEALSPTQPFSTLALNPGPAVLDERHMWGITPIDQMWCRIQFRRARYEGAYTPPGTSRPSIAYPGMFGGIEWGGVSVDPSNQVLVANANAMPFIVRMEATATVINSTQQHPEGTSSGLSQMQGTGHAVSYYGFLSPLQVPCMQPPWGKLYAIDLKTQRIMWEIKVGTARDTGPLGISSHLPLPIGTPQAGGSTITRGGLIFAAATLDKYLRAYDLRDGRELWRVRLPAGGQATPMTYAENGHQYVVIASGGHGVLGTTSGDYVLAYSLQ